MKKNNYLCIDNKYQLNYDTRLGEGTCGAVYLGCYFQGIQDKSFNKNSNQLLAIKEIPVNSKFETADSMLQEINVLRMLQDKSIVRFIDAKRNKFNMYMIMEFCSGGTLEDYIEKYQDELTINDKIIKMAQILQGFKLLYEHKILHRDIKPANILLQDGYPKLADFGMAKIIDEGMNQNYHYTFKGTPTFIAPQLIMREQYTDKCDIWSLGVTFYYLLFHHYPWNDPSPITLLNTIKKKINSDNLFPYNTDVPQQVKDLISRMLKYEESDRISWQELFEHELFQEYYQSETHKSQIRDRVQDQIEPLTKQSFEYHQKAETNNENDQLEKEKMEFQMAINEYQVTQRYQQLSEEQSNCRNCLQLIKCQLDKASFFFKSFQNFQEQYNLQKDYKMFQNSQTSINQNSILSFNKNDSSTDISSSGSIQETGGLSSQRSKISLMNSDTQELKLSAQRQQVQLLGKKNSITSIKPRSSSVSVSFNISPDLYQKCQYLLLKRSYILIYDLFTLISYRTTHFQGSTEILPEYWESLVHSTDKQHAKELQEYNQLIQKEKYKIEKQYQSQVVEFQDAQRTYMEFNLIDREDAYNSKTLLETKNLVLAFNDNFKELFYILASALLKAFYNNRQNNIQSSKQKFIRDNKIDITFVYDLMIILSFRRLRYSIIQNGSNDSQFRSSGESVRERDTKKNQNKKNELLSHIINFKRYNEDKKHADLLTLLYRIESQFKTWFENDKLFDDIQHTLTKSNKNSKDKIEIEQ